MRKTNSSFVRTCLPLALFQLGLLLCPALPAAVQVNITPSTVSNTYNGTITLQVTGLAAGGSVVVQKFLDLNASGVVQPGDYLVQEFSLTDGQPGMVIGGVNNSNVPGDSDSISGQITAKLNFLNGDFIQDFVGQYLYVISSPSGSFTPITNLFMVTNATFAQSFNGTVVSNGTSTTLPNALVVLVYPNSGAVGGVVANNSGYYTIAAPPGTYELLAFKSNYLFNENYSPIVTLGSGQTITTNLTATNTTASISGQLFDANSSVGLPGVFLGARASSGGLSGMGFTDSNGNFTLPVPAGQSGLKAQATSLIISGYVAPDNRTNVTAGQTGISLPTPRATALVYGSVKDSLGNPMPGLEVVAEDNNELYYPEAFTDANGNYFLGVLGGLGGDLWQVQLSSDNLPTNYLFSQPGFDNDGDGTNITSGQAVLVNFTAVLATNTISGYLKDASGNPISGVGIYASATISGVYYNQGSVDTGANGFYSLNVANGTWSVGVNSGGGGDDDLPGGYLAPANQTAVIANNNATVNFTALTAGNHVTGYLTNAVTGAGIPNVGVPCWATIDGAQVMQYARTDNNGFYSNNLANGTWNVNLNTGDCSDCLPSSLYVCLNDSQTVVIANDNAVVNFSAIPVANQISGYVKDNNNNPIAGVGVWANASINGTNYNEGTVDTDGTGHYSMGVVNGTWTLGVSTCSDCNDGLPANYLCPNQQSFVILNNSPTVNFTVLLATNDITGSVQDSNGNPISGAAVWASATVNGTNYTQQGATGAGGIYTLDVVNGSWNVGVYCNNGPSDNLDDILGPGNYQCPAQAVGLNIVNNNNGTANFLVQLCSGIAITNTSLPAGRLDVYYDQFVGAVSCSSTFSWSILAGSFPPGLNGNPYTGEIYGTPTATGTYDFTVQVIDGNGLTAEQAFSLTINGGVLQVTTAALSAGTTNVPYNSQQLTAGGGLPPYTWSLASGTLPSGLSLSTGGLISGTPTVAGTSNFVVKVTDSASATATQALSLTVYVYSSSVTFTVTPPVISNTYSGVLTLLVQGLYTGETVTVSKYLDLNSNGVIDAGDPLVQQFELTDGQAGMVIGGITNYLVPGDLDTTPGQITASLYFPDGDFMQNLVGQYIFRVGSPIHRFSPATNLFLVTNTPYPQEFTGSVLNSSNGAPVPDAIVFLFPPSSPQNGGPSGPPLAGVVANNSGAYTLQVPPGNYWPVAFKSNYLTSFATMPALTLGSGATVVTNLELANATAGISGQLVNANNPSLPLPGVMVTAGADNGLVALGFTDTNGSYTVGVGTGDGQWSVSAQDTSLIVLGYVGLYNGINAYAGQTDVTLAVPLASAMFYGRVTDSLGNPMVGLDIGIWDNNNVFQCDSGTAPGGYYEAAVLGGLNNDGWQIQINGGNLPVNYMFSQPGFDQNGGTNLDSDTALPVNFVGLVATNTISGYLKDGSGNPFANIGISGSATINGANFNPYVDTDSNGHYSMTVGAGAWTVSVNTWGGNDSLPGDYVCPSQSVVISNQNATLNFTAALPTTTISGFVLNNSGAAISGVQVWANGTVNGQYYSFQANTDSDGYYSLTAPNGTWTVGLNTGTGSGVLPSDYLCPQSQTVVIDNANGTANFIVIPTTHTISGILTDNNGNPIPNIGLSAYAQINGVGYNSVAGETDADGWYSLNVINGDWNVFLLGPGGYDSLPTSYVCPSSDSVVIDNNNGTANFVAIPATAVISGYVKDSNGNPIGGVGVGAGATINSVSYYVNTDTAADGSYSLNVAAGYWDVSVNCYNGGDSLENLGDYACPNDQYTTITTSGATINFIVQLCGGVSIAPSMPPGEVGASYDQFLQASSCNPSFTWSLLAGMPPPGLTGNPYTGEITGAPEAAGTFTFTVQVTDGNGATTNGQVTIGISNAVEITTDSLPNGYKGSAYSEQLQAAGGQAPYSWSLNYGSLPPGLSLSGSGLISGEPTEIGTFSFCAQLEDNLGGYTTQFFPVTLTIQAGAPPAPAIGSPAKMPGGQFEFLLTGAASQNYTILVSTNLGATNWTTLFVTNCATTNSYHVIDSNPAGSERFYRVKVGP